MLKIGLSRLRMKYVVLLIVISNNYQGVFPASRGTRLQEITVGTFSIQVRWGEYDCDDDRSWIGSKINTLFFRSAWLSVFGSIVLLDRVGSKKCGRQFPVSIYLSAWRRSGKHRQIDLGERSDTYIHTCWGEKYQLPTFPGQKLIMRTSCWKGHFQLTLQIRLHKKWP